MRIPCPRQMGQQKKQTLLPLFLPLSPIDNHRNRKQKKQTTPSPKTKRKKNGKAKRPTVT